MDLLGHLGGLGCDFRWWPPIISNHHFCASDCDFHLSIYAIHKATYIRNKNLIADLSLKNSWMKQCLQNFRIITFLISF
jgi:hypothetical protein